MVNRQRSFFYGCAANHQRGEAICANGLEIPMAMADGAVLEMVEQSILTPAVIEEAIDRLFSMVNEPSDEAARRAANLQGEIDRLEAEVTRLTEAIAEGGLSIDAIRWEALQQLSEWKGLLARRPGACRAYLASTPRTRSCPSSAVKKSVMGSRAKT